MNLQEELDAVEDMLSLIPEDDVTVRMYDRILSSAEYGYTYALGYYIANYKWELPPDTFSIMAEQDNLRPMRDAIVRDDYTTVEILLKYGVKPDAWSVYHAIQENIQFRHLLSLYTRIAYNVVEPQRDYVRSQFISNGLFESAIKDWIDERYEQAISKLAFTQIVTPPLTDDIILYRGLRGMGDMHRLSVGGLVKVGHDGYFSASALEYKSLFFTTNGCCMLRIRIPKGTTGLIPLDWKREGECEILVRGEYVFITDAYEERIYKQDGYSVMTIYDAIFIDTGETVVRSRIPSFTL